jgi:hypothetical protein
MYVQTTTVYVQACRCSGYVDGMCACRVSAKNTIELLIIHWVAWALVTQNRK